MPVVSLDPPVNALGADLSAVADATQQTGGRYATGVYQPATIVLSSGFDPIFHFVGTPQARNYGGACSVRPTAAEVLEAVRAYQRDGASTTYVEKLFPWTAVAMLLAKYFANGHFIQPVPLALDALGRQRARNGRAIHKLRAAALVVGVSGVCFPKQTAAGLALYGSYIYLVWSSWIRRVLWIGGKRPGQAM